MFLLILLVDLFGGCINGVIIGLHLWIARLIGRAFLDIVEKIDLFLLRKGATKHSNRKRGLTIMNHTNAVMVLRKSGLSSSKWSLMNSLHI